MHFGMSGLLQTSILRYCVGHLDLSMLLMNYSILNTFDHVSCNCTDDVPHGSYLAYIHIFRYIIPMVIPFTYM